MEKYQPIGKTRTNVNLDEIQREINKYNEKVNNLKTPYQPLGPNSNGYINSLEKDALKSFGIENPEPNITVFGWSKTTESWNAEDTNNKIFYAVKQ